MRFKAITSFQYYLYFVASCSFFLVIMLCIHKKQLSLVATEYSRTSWNEKSWICRACSPKRGSCVLSKESINLVRWGYDVTTSYHCWVCMTILSQQNQTTFMKSVDTLRLERGERPPKKNSSYDVLLYLHWNNRNNGTVRIKTRKIDFSSAEASEK